MNKVDFFKASLLESAPNQHLSPLLKSLWYDGNGDWNKAHALVDHLTDKDAAAVHAYLHRKEGDIWNADYWYAKAKKNRPTISLEEEWTNLVEQYL